MSARRSDGRRIALIGNMNNGNFSLLRHMLDLGVDAELLMYGNEAEHFYPQHDTWDWERWAPHVRQLPWDNGGRDALRASKAALERELGGYDAYIANGIAPVWFQRMGRTLDLFVPYAEGVEFIVEHHWRWGRPLSSVYSLLRKIMMERALQSSVRTIGTANMHDHSLSTYRRLGISPINLPLVPLYVEPAPSAERLPAYLREVMAIIDTHEPVLFSHVSHIWKNLPVPHFMGGVGKRNQWLIEGFARYVRESGNERALLCLVEYGRDVPESRALIESLGIESLVRWLPQMSRREIMCVLPHVDLGGSEFAGMFWGGCGWEFLASGVPMLHQLEDPQAFETPDRPLPPFFNVHSPQEIARVLATQDPAQLQRVGARGRAWFEKHQGRALARRYLELTGSG